MTKQNWVGKMYGLLCSPQARKSRRHRRLIRVEPVEQRLLLTAYLIDTVDDVGLNETDGLLSLREAVIASSTNAAYGDAAAGMANGDTIEFALAAGSSLELNFGELLITDDLSIDGSNLDITIDAMNLSRIFNIETTDAVELTNLTLTNGETVDGPGGGAILNNGAELHIADSVITNSLATGLSGSGGGLLTVDGEVTIHKTTFSFNSANRAGGAIEVIDGTVLLVGSNLVNNDVSGLAAGTPNPGNGGGLHVTGVAEVTLDGGSVFGNEAASEGGGLWNQAGSTLKVRNGALVSANSAFGNDADNGGGGIFNNGGTLIINHSTISDNFADGTSGSGGGIFSTAGTVNVNRSSLEGNSANRAGGGIEIVNGHLTLNRVGLNDNVAGPEGTAAPGNGGGLHVSGADAHVRVERSEVRGNTAAREGGGLWNQAGSTMTVFRSNVEGNRASGTAADDGGGGIFNNGGDLHVFFSEISRNVADGAAGSGGGIFSTDGSVSVVGSDIEANTANRAGGGVEIVDGSLTLTFVDLDYNVAGPVGSAAPGNGGGLHVTGADAVVQIAFSSVEHNLAANEGGGLWNQAGSEMSVFASRIQHNEAAGAGGGGLFNNGGQLFVSYSKIRKNEASDGDGGGLFLKAGGTAEIGHTRIDHNEADNRGGGIFNGGGLQVSRSFVRFNDAANDGGGMFTDAGATTDLDTRTRVRHNHPNNFGGPGNVN